VVLVHVGSGTTASVVVSQSAATTQRYVAQIDSHGGPPIQAMSTPILVTWSGTSTGGGGTAPTVSAVSPIWGPSTGGTSVTITGTGFTGATSVLFGGAPATAFSVVSSTSITATAPAISGTVDVTVSTSSGSSATSPADQFTGTFSTGGYAATLAASTTSPTVGQSVTLTATANQDMGPTPYGMSIVDASTGVVLVHIGSGTTASVVVSQSAAMTQRYVAQIDSHGGPPIQAMSTPIVITWS
jgi:hypothetical protein